MNDKQTKSWPWYLFMHTFAIIALSMAVVGALALASSCMDLALPEPNEFEIDSLRCSKSSGLECG